MGLQETIERKKEWRVLQKRANTLPKDYTIVYKEIQKYLMKVNPIELTTDFTPLTELLDLLEVGAKQGKDVLEVTGKDVAAFADELIDGKKICEETIQKQVDQAVEKSTENWLNKL
ncbi:hypothetical protein IGI37_000868 [Enterococcus sp. AZ194]|uniref:DUF1048 domain-containing protein n=1 Tax=Enterococcus sp. AZ194 TaxID=2774629 RepID=UPI003F23BFB1